MKTTLVLTILIILISLPVSNNVVNIVPITTETPTVNITTETPTVNITTETLTINITNTIDYSYLLNQRGKLLDYYPENSCELIANIYQEEYSGNIIFIAPYNTDSNAWIIDSYAGHYINILSINGTDIYADYGLHQIFDNKNNAILFYDNNMRNKFENENIGVKFFIVGEDAMPYPIIHH